MTDTDRTAVVTGGRGAAGTWVVRHLAEAGWHVVCIDLEIPDRTPEGLDVEFRAADLTDQGAAWQLVMDSDPDAVVHMAAIPRVGIRAGTATFETNVTSTYNVFVAAGEVGAKLVWTSSNSTYGQVFAEHPPLPEYLPIDEDHPLRPEDPYGTSKVVGEELAGMTTRRYGVPVVSIRPPLIQHPGRYETAERRRTFDPATAERNGGFWSYVDVRDVATAIGAALTTDIVGHEAFLIAAETNYLDRPTADVIEAVYGGLPDRCTLEGDQSVYSTAKAREHLDWEPRHDWRTAETETVEDPVFGAA